MATKKKTTKAKRGAQSAPLVAVYGIDKESPRGQQLQQVVKELGFFLRVVPPEQLNNPVGYVAGQRGYRPAANPFVGEPPAEEFLFLAGFDRRQMNALLEALKEAELSIPLKAMLTPLNGTWTFGQLIEAVAQEHNQLSASPEQATSPEETE